MYSLHSQQLSRQKPGEEKNPESNKTSFKWRDGIILEYFIFGIFCLMKGRRSAEKKNKTLGTATKWKYCGSITRFLMVQQIEERNIALQSFWWQGWILAWRECKLDEFEWRTRPSCTAARAKWLGKKRSTCEQWKRNKGENKDKCLEYAKTDLANYSSFLVWSRLKRVSPMDVTTIG